MDNIKEFVLFTIWLPVLHFIHSLTRTFLRAVQINWCRKVIAGRETVFIPNNRHLDMELQHDIWNGDVGVKCAQTYTAIINTPVHLLNVRPL